MSDDPARPFNPAEHITKPVAKPHFVTVSQAERDRAIGWGIFAGITFASFVLAFLAGFWTAGDGGSFDVDEWDYWPLLIWAGVWLLLVTSYAIGRIVYERIVK